MRCRMYISNEYLPRISRRLLLLLTLSENNMRSMQKLVTQTMKELIQCVCDLHKLAAMKTTQVIRKPKTDSGPQIVH